MTYGDFAWSSHLGRSAAKRRRSDRPRPVFVEGDPVPWMDFGEDDWVWRVSRAVRQAVPRPHLVFVVGARASSRSSIDDWAKPVLDEISSHPRSVWVELREGDRPGVKINDVAPPFPPKIDRSVEVPFESGRDDLVEIRKALGTINPLRGSGDVGAHFGFGRVQLGDFDYGGPVRVMFDALSKTLGGTEGRPGDLRIRDLRVARDPGRVTGCEVRLWSIDR